MATVLQDKNADLIAVKRKKLLESLVNELGRAGHDLYYTPTTQIASSLLEYAKGPAGLSADERAVLEGLSQRDVQILLGLQS